MSTMKERIASLRSTKGATILMALLALLVAAMVSTVILAAAMSTVKQEKLEVEFQQCQLDLQSAAQYSLIDIIGDLEGKSSEKGGVTVTVTATCEVKNGVEEWTYGGPQLSSRSAVYGQALVDAVKAIHYSSTPLVNGVYAASLPDFVLEKTSDAAGSTGSGDFEPRTVKVKLTAAPKASDVSNTGTADDAAYEYILEFSSANSVRDAAHQGTSQVLYLRLSEHSSDEKLSEDDKRTTVYSWTFDRFEALGSDGSEG